MEFGVYIHFPYCRKRCAYCDFDIHVRRNLPHERYADAVVRELELRAPLFEGRSLSSIYFGGGTPSLWDPPAVARVVSAIRGVFPSENEDSKEVEVTLEANPDDLPRERLAALRRAGINRLSLGGQSFDARQLATLGRLHGADEIRRSVEFARAEGFANLSVDLMYGLPGQSAVHLEGELAALIALAVPHVSAYQLTVEENTPFGAYRRRGTLPLVGDAALADMIDQVHAGLEAAGYVHYEVSSYARPGARAVHNSLYWQGGEWLGLGCAAHSFLRHGDGGTRWSTVKNVDRYLAASTSDGQSLYAQREPLTADTLSREAMWLGLRLLDEGVDRRAFLARHGHDPLDRYASVLEKLRDQELLTITEERIRLTRRGALLADDVGARFL